MIGETITILGIIAALLFYWCYEGEKLLASLYIAVVAIVLPWLFTISWPTGEGYVLQEGEKLEYVVYDMPELKAAKVVILTPDGLKEKTISGNEYLLRDNIEEIKYYKGTSQHFWWVYEHNKTTIHYKGPNESITGEAE